MILPLFIILSIFGFMIRGEEQPLRSKCNDCYFKHYEAKGCIPIYDSRSTCPIRFNCPEKEPDDPSVCYFKEKTYKEGEVVEVGNPCEECMCEKSYANEGLEVICNSIECADEFELHLNASCYWAYQENRCCPEKYCPSVAAAPKKGCEYDGKTYRYGEEIYIGDSKKCICNENWSGAEGSNCRHIGCLTLDLEHKALQDGGIPIYYEDICCPIEFLSPKYTDTLTTSLATKEDIDNGSTCTFKDTHYKIGQNLDYKGQNSCVTCSCDTPPDFTCVQRRCPHPPNDDYENCKTKFTSGECCPAYECIL